MEKRKKRRIETTRFLGYWNDDVAFEKGYVRWLLLYFFGLIPFFGRVFLLSAQVSMFNTGIRRWTTHSASAAHVIEKMDKTKDRYF